MSVFTLRKKETMSISNTENECRLTQILKEIKERASNVDCYKGCESELDFDGMVGLSSINASWYRDLFYLIDDKVFTFTPKFAKTMFVCRILKSKQIGNSAKELMKSYVNTIRRNLSGIYLTQVNSGIDDTYTQTSICIRADNRSSSGYLLPEYIEVSTLKLIVFNYIDRPNSILYDILSNDYVQRRIHTVQPNIQRYMVKKVGMSIDDLKIITLRKSCELFWNPLDLVCALFTQYIEPQEIPYEQKWNACLVLVDLMQNFEFEFPANKLPALKKLLHMILIYDLPQEMLGIKTQIAFAELYHLVTGERLVLNANILSESSWKYIEQIQPSVDFTWQFYTFVSKVFNPNSIQVGAMTC